MTLEEMINLFRSTFVGKTIRAQQVEEVGIETPEQTNITPMTPQ